MRDMYSGWTKIQFVKKSSPSRISILEYKTYPTNIHLGLYSIKSQKVKLNVPNAFSKKILKGKYKPQQILIKFIHGLEN